MTREQAVQVCAKLLRLAARGGTVGEAAAAAAKAEEILTRFELTADLVAGLERGPDEAAASFGDAPEGWLDDAARLVRWRYELSVRVSRLHGCFVFQGRRGRGTSLEIVGRPSEVEAVRYLFAWLAGEVEQLTARHGRGMGTVWRNNFARGAVDEIGRRLREQRDATAAEVRAEQASNPHALMIVARSLERITEHAVEAREVGYRVHKLRQTSSRGSRFDGNAREAGRAAGRSVNLSARRQIGGRS